MVHVTCLSSNDDLAKTRALLSEHITGTKMRVYKFEYKIQSLASVELIRESLYEQATRLLDALLRLSRPGLEVNIAKSAF